MIFYEKSQISYVGREEKINSFWENYLNGWNGYKDEFNKTVLIKNIEKDEQITNNQAILEYLDSSET